MGIKESMDSKFNEEERRENWEETVGRVVSYLIKISENKLTKANYDSIRNAILSYDTLSFATAAVRLSEDNDSKNNGGLMVNPYSGSSFFELDQLDPSVYIAIENLKMDEISESTVYSTRDGKKGYSLYYVLKRKEAHKANIQMDYQIIQEAALAKRKQEVIDKWIETKLTKTYSDLNENYKNCVFRSKWTKLN